MSRQPIPEEILEEFHNEFVEHPIMSIEALDAIRLLDWIMEHFISKKQCDERISRMVGSKESSQSSNTNNLFKD